MSDPSIPNSAYVHIPFCRHRCGYCNFALVAKRDYLIDRFLSALATELSRLDQGYTLQTLFLGGGTPTHLTAPQLTRLFTILQRRFDFTKAEVTSEANPSDLNTEKIQVLHDLGVNRFSLGVQSFHDSKLKLLERDHSADQVRQVVGELQNYTENISLDLIFAAMGETLEMWQADLEQAISLNPKHLSTYELTIEKGTQFWKRERSGQLSPTDEDLRTDMYQHTIHRLNNCGLDQYEISSFAAEGFRCQHNLIYWSGRSYLAFGAGASRYVGGVRETNHSSVSAYLKRLESGESPTVFSEKLDAIARAHELLVIGLRKIDGVQELAYRQLTGFGFDEVLSEKARSLFELGLIERSGEQLRLTPRGVLLYDSVAETILDGP